jgi:glycosyltransferase involved in cell wall biosynthesis
LGLSEFYDIYLVANFSGFEKELLNDLPIKHIENIGINRRVAVFKDLKALLLLIRYFKENNFDAVHSVTPKAGLLGIVGARLAGLKVRIHIFTGQVWHTKRGLLKKLLMFLDRLIVRNATFILVDGETQRQFLIENAIVQSSNSKVLGNGSISGVDIAKFKPDLKVRMQVRQELGINNDEVVFMFLGRMNRDKGIPELAVAFDNISQNNKKVRLLLVGDDEEKMTHLVKNTVLAIDKVIFCGATPQPEHLLQACDIFCLPSHREGFGTSIIEASLLQKPIICSNTYGLMETILDNYTGIRHKVNNIETLQKAMETLLIDEDLRLKYGENGRNYILKHFTSQQITGKWIDFYREIFKV